jgi:hypothetical protein
MDIYLQKPKIEKDYQGRHYVSVSFGSLIKAAIVINLVISAVAMLFWSIIFVIIAVLGNL